MSLSKKTSMQYYDEEAHTFLADRYITGECLAAMQKVLTVTSVKNVEVHFLPQN